MWITHYLSRKKAFCPKTMKILVLLAKILLAGGNEDERGNIKKWNYRNVRGDKRQKSNICYFQYSDEVFFKRIIVRKKDGN